jgi:hypothetical protein
MSNCQPIKTGTLVISDGDEPSLRMVRIVEIIVGNDVIAPYLREDRDRNLQRFDRRYTTLVSLTPVSHFGMRIDFSIHGTADDMASGVPPRAKYSDGLDRCWRTTIGSIRLSRAACRIIARTWDTAFADDGEVAA